MMSLRIALPMAVLFTLFSSATTMADETMQTVDKQAMEWLRNIQFNTVQIVDQAETLKTMARDPGTYDRASHEFELLKIKSEINRIGDLVPKLQNSADAPKWQKGIIDEVASLLAAMGDQTEQALTFVHDIPTEARLNSNVYEYRIAGIYQYAKHINEIVDYADTRVELKRQKEQAELTTTTS